ncbi:MAG: hypothetical protein EP312_10185, partial [Gammaproteobacteria bacterium]
MKLHHQLLAVSALLLSLPWVAYQTVREMESALRAGQAQALSATAEAVAASLSVDASRLYPYPNRLDEPQDAQQQLVFLPAREAVIVDGYGNEWESTPARIWQGEQDLAVAVRSNACGKRLCLLFDVTDGDVRYDNPSRSAATNGDHIVLHGGDGSQWVLASSAPGAINVLRERGKHSMVDTEVIAQWQDTVNGYRVEVSLPVDGLFGRLGFRVVDEDAEGTQVIGNMSLGAGMAPPWLIREPEGLPAQLAIFQRPGLRLRVIDRFHWQLAESGSINTGTVSDAHWVLRHVYRAVLRNGAGVLPAERIEGQFTRTEISHALAGQSGGQWYRNDDPQARQLLSAAAPMRHQGQVIGAVVAEQSNEPYLSLTDHAFSRLLKITLLAMALTGFGLLGYASWLSWRIRRLSRAARGMLGQKGEW